MATYTQAQIVQIITDEANALGVPVNLALAIARQESGLNPNVAGDGGHSIGLFQLNDRGEGAGMSVAQRQDPRTNARIALTQVANVIKSSPGLSPGQIAAAAQRPKDRAGYAQAIDAALGQHLSPEQYADMSPEGIAYRQNALASGGTGGGGGGSGDVFGDIDGFLQSQAPALAAAINDPKVHDLLSQWGAGQLSDQEFQQKLENTDWWKNTPQSQRTLLVSQATDPATARQNLANQMASVDSLAWQLGAKLTPDIEYRIALDSIKNQWSSQQVQSAIAAQNKTTYTASGQYGGQAASDVQQIKNLYASYALPVDDHTLNNLVSNVLAGKGTVQDLQQQVAQQAATFYAANPALSEFLKSGQGDAQSWAAPLVSKVANILGVNPNSIDLTNSQWSFILKPQTNPQTGQSTGMAQTLDSVEQKIKTDPVYGYSKTANGIQDYQSLDDAIRAGFGAGKVA